MQPKVWAAALAVSVTSLSALASAQQSSGGSVSTPMRRYSTEAMVAGVVMQIVGGVGIVAGTGLLATARGPCDRASVSSTDCSGGDGQRIGGAAALSGGAALLLVGAVLTVVGAQMVPMIRASAGSSGSF